jgi:hypothetical protein
LTGESRDGKDKKVQPDSKKGGKKTGHSTPRPELNPWNVEEMDYKTHLGRPFLGEFGDLDLRGRRVVSAAIHL